MNPAVIAEICIYAVLISLTLIFVTGGRRS